MRITRGQLRKIVREEVVMLREGADDPRLSPEIMNKLEELVEELVHAMTDSTAKNFPRVAKKVRDRLTQATIDSMEDAARDAWGDPDDYDRQVALARAARK